MDNTARLTDAVQFLKTHLQRNEFNEGVFLTFLCGYCQTYTKKARELAKTCLDMGIVWTERRHGERIWVIPEQ